MVFIFIYYIYVTAKILYISPSPCNSYPYYIHTVICNDFSLLHGQPLPMLSIKPQPLLYSLLPSRFLIHWTAFGGCPFPLDEALLQTVGASSLCVRLPAPPCPLFPTTTFLGVRRKTTSDPFMKA